MKCYAKPYRLKHHGLAAGVSTRDEELTKPATSHFDINRHHLILGNRADARGEKWMARA